MVILMGVGGAYGFMQYQQTQQKLEQSQLELEKIKSDPQAASIEENTALVSKIGELITLPEGEDPTIATITDVERLREQDFFNKAENDDKILIYTQVEQRAILYRPSINKVIEVAPVNIGETEGQVQTLSVAIYNGTRTEEVNDLVENEIVQNAAGFEVILKTDAQRNHNETLVVDLSGDQDEAAEELAEVLNAIVAILPAGEDRPETETDLLVIVGTDKE